MVSVSCRCSGVLPYCVFRYRSWFAYCSDGALLLELTDEELEKELGFKGLQVCPWARTCPACICCSTAQHLTLSKLLPCRSRS